MFKSEFDREPDGVNELGVRWWKDEFVTDYATRPDLNGVKLPNIKIYLVETPEKYRTRLMLDGEDVIYEAQTLEAMAVRIDIMKIDINLS